jgi:hypothetical protein
LGTSLTTTPISLALCLPERVASSTVTLTLHSSVRQQAAKRWGRACEGELSGLP